MVQFYKTFCTFFNCVLIGAFLLSTLALSGFSTPDYLAEQVHIFGWLMLAQPAVVWLLVFRRPELVPGIAIFGFLLLQSSGLVRAYGSEAPWLLSSMGVTLLASLLLWSRPLAGKIAGVHWRAKAVLVGFLVVLYLVIANQSPATFGLVPVPSVIYLVAGPLMVFQVFAIWGFTLQAWRSDGPYEGLDWQQISLFATLQVAGTVLALVAEDPYVAASMLLSLAGTVGTATLKGYKQRWAHRAATPAE